MKRTPLKSWAEVEERILKVTKKSGNRERCGFYPSDSQDITKVTKLLLAYSSLPHLPPLHLAVPKRQIILKNRHANRKRAEDWLTFPFPFVLHPFGVVVFLTFLPLLPRVFLSSFVSLKIGLISKKSVNG